LQAGKSALRARHIKDCGWFFGTLEIVIDDGEVVDTLTYMAEFIPAKVYVGRADADDRIKDVELKAQRGVFAPIECCGFEARCLVLEYEVSVVNEQGHRSIKNLGAKFSESTIKLISSISPGDLVMFRYISYRCVSTDSTGQRAPDMVFTVE